MDFIDKITSKIDFPEPMSDSECWNWKPDASRTTSGVPRIKHKKEWVPVRRALYVHIVGPIPESRMVKSPNIRMGCGNPDCVNPHHARVITDFDRLVTQHEKEVYHHIVKKDGDGKPRIKKLFRKRAGIAAAIARKTLEKQDLTKAEFQQYFYNSLPDDLNPYALAARTLRFWDQRDGKAVTGRDIIEALEARQHGNGTQPGI